MFRPHPPRTSAKQVGHSSLAAGRAVQDQAKLQTMLQRKLPRNSTCSRALKSPWQARSPTSDTQTVFNPSLLDSSVNTHVMSERGGGSDENQNAREDTMSDLLTVAMAGFSKRSRSPSTPAQRKFLEAGLRAHEKNTCARRMKMLI